MDHLIAPLAAASLDAIEADHSDHDAPTRAHYRALAARLGLLVTGGSDFHGATGHRTARLGEIRLPAEDFERLSRAAGRRRAH
jgi:predicted metal-dependent phosphoesterase TrpH